MFSCRHRRGHGNWRCEACRLRSVSAPTFILQIPHGMASIYLCSRIAANPCESPEKCSFIPAFRVKSWSFKRTLVAANHRHARALLQAPASAVGGDEDNVTGTAPDTEVCPFAPSPLFFLRSGYAHSLASRITRIHHAPQVARQGHA